jgi:hypothetical protein
MRSLHQTLSWGGGRGKTLPQQVVNNSVAVQQEKWSIRLYMYSGKLNLAAIYLQRVGIDGRSYAAAPTHVSTVVTPPTCGTKPRRRPAAALLGRCVAEQSK